MTYTEIMRILEAKREEQETVSTFRHEFNYRPHDGAVATAIVLKARYGLVVGKAIPTMFGSRPPEILDVPTESGHEGDEVFHGAASGRLRRTR